MFENILGHPRLVETLSLALRDKKTPPAMLLTGPNYSGKLSLALEIARALNCQTGRADWKCPCSSCWRHRLLEHPNLLLVGPRYFEEDLAACAAAFSHKEDSGSRYLFFRAARKLQKRWDSVLWSGRETAYKAVAATLEKLSDALRLLRPGRDFEPDFDLEKNKQTIIDLAAKAATGNGLKTVSIDQIRRVKDWAHTTSRNARIIIIENCEHMTAGARNGLLKILEEPPPEVYFILLTCRKKAIIPTILSRLRAFEVPERTKAAQREVLKRIFRSDSSDDQDLREFFISHSPALSALREQVFVYWQAAKGSQAWSSDKFEPLFPAKSKVADFRFFLEELIALWQAELRQKQASVDYNHALLTQDLLKEAHNCFEQWEIYHQNPIRLAEALFLKIQYKYEEIY